jgi:hypothetical protein
MDMMATETNDRLEAALQYALDRLRTTESQLSQTVRLQQQTAAESAGLRAELAAIEESCATLRRTLLATEDSDEYKSLQWLQRVVVPSGSLRRRFCAAGFRNARRLGHGLRSCLKLLHSDRPIRSSLRPSEDAQKPLALPAAENRPLTPGDAQDQEPRQPAPVAPEELAYRPGLWPLPEQAPEAEGLDLLLLSPVPRTGSTLLQRICNSRKGTLIWGEHGGALTRFAAIFADAASFSLLGDSQRQQYFGQDENPNLWIAAMSPELELVQQALVDSARALMNGLYGPYRQGHDILGFKEVRYGRAELELLRRCYPKAQFLLLLRNPLHTWRSTPRQWYPSLDYWAAIYNDGVQGYRDFAKRDSNCHLLRYEDLIQQESKTIAILADVAKVSPQQISMVLSHKIGSSNRTSLADSDRDFILQNCRESMELLGYTTRDKTVPLAA